LNGLVIVSRPRSGGQIARGALLGLSIAVSLLGSACARHTERESPRAVATGGRWREAYVTVEYSPSFFQSGKDHPAQVTHDLFVEEAPPNRAMVILSLQNKDYTSAEEFSALQKTRYTVRFAPDNTAVAASTDEEKTWTVINLEPLSVPVSSARAFWCRHRSFPSLSPWPSLHAIALELLASVDPGSPAALVHRAAGVMEWPGPVRSGPGRAAWLEELDGASQYVCRHRENVELRSALVEAALRPDYPMLGADCLGKIVLADPALKHRIEGMLGAAPEPHRARLQSLLDSAVYEAKQPAH
jgi:hypothetical protein